MEDFQIVINIELDHPLPISINIFMSTVGVEYNIFCLSLIHIYPLHYPYFYV